MKSLLLRFSAAIAAVAIAVTLAAQSALVSTLPVEKIDTVFSNWTQATPGCSVGAAVGSSPVLARSYGMADLEHDVPNTPETIFEAGSVSKQFTAAAVLLLAREGKLSLDDPARKYVPELPVYNASGFATTDADAPVTPHHENDGADAASEGGGTPGGPTIRQMLNHTSGLRDWGSIEAIAGWPRTTRVYTHAHVLDIVSRQHALNFPAGTRWSYSNTGFNLAAIIVTRVSGVPFAEFTKQRIFEPLGMMHTSWRDDHTRVVKGRAMAYRKEKDGFHTLMPFEDIHGNGGLLTTVGDLLKWNENFVSPIVGDAAFVEQQQRVGKFNDGRSHDYGFGLFIGSYKGVREVSHSGSTAGYEAFLTRFPDQHVSVAVLCNATTAKPRDYAHAVADLLLGDAARADGASKPAHTAGELDRAQGLYRSVETGLPLHVTREKADFRDGESWTRDDDSRQLHVTDRFGRVELFEQVEPASPAPDKLRELVGTYSSADAETTVTVAIEGDGLVLKRRPDTTITLTPVYRDVFSGRQGQFVIFRRDAMNRTRNLSIVDPRVWDMRFTRQN